MYGIWVLVVVHFGTLKIGVAGTEMKQFSEGKAHWEW
jgi:hypothetical protein